MFSPDIISSDVFLDMPMSSQALYFHLGMRADDDGFVSPKMVMRQIGSADDDLKVLLAKRFVLHFECGVVVIKHWLIHNLIRADLYKETLYKKEKLTLGLNENGAYTELREGVPMLQVPEAPEWLKKRRGGLRTANVPQTVPRLGKDRLGKDSKPTGSIEFLRMVPKEFLDAFSQEYGISPKGIQSKATDLRLWAESKGKVYKNYKSFLENAIKKDQVSLRSQFPARVAPQVSQSVKEASEMSAEQIAQNKTRIAAMSADLAETFRGA